MRIEIIIVPYDSGRRGFRMGAGPERLIAYGLEETLRATGCESAVATIELADGFAAEIAAAFELNRLLARRVRAAIAEKNFPLVCAGNCNSTLGTIAGTGDENIGLVWFDAHGDFNTPETTESGFFDGMGLATIAGRCWQNMAVSVPGFRPIAGRRIVHIAARDVSAVESELMADASVRVVGAAIIRGSEMAAIEPALAALRKEVETVHIHLDLDVLDPEEAPANEFAVAGGLSVGQAEAAIRMIKSRFAISSATIASYDPAVDPDGRTAKAALRLVTAIIGT
jgi:arginase